MARPMGTSGIVTRRSVLWVPMLLLGAVLYWSVALGLGGMSLAMLGGAVPSEDTGCPGESAELAAAAGEPEGNVEDAIVVRLASPDEARVYDTMRRGATVKADRAPPARSYDGPGRTSY